LLSACLNGHIEVVALLLENKANIEATDMVRKVCHVKDIDVK
jgi:ankyrin repeat protein